MSFAPVHADLPDEIVSIILESVAKHISARDAKVSFILAVIQRISAIKHWQSAAAQWCYVRDTVQPHAVADHG